MILLHSGNLLLFLLLTKCKRRFQRHYRRRTRCAPVSIPNHRFAQLITQDGHFKVPGQSPGISIITFPSEYAFP